jgi:hypothetical protein
MENLFGICALGVETWASGFTIHHLPFTIHH